VEKGEGLAGMGLVGLREHGLLAHCVLKEDCGWGLGV